MLNPKLVVMIQQELENAHKKHPRGYPDEILRGCTLMVEEAGESLKAANDATRDAAPSLEQLRAIHHEVLQTIVNCIQYLNKLEKRVEACKATNQS